MANWKKVIVSGSNAHLNHITSSGDISASGKLYGSLDQNTDQEYVVVYNTATGELEYKLLNLINAKRAPELYLIDLYSSEYSSQEVDFKLSYDSGSPSLPTNTQAPQKVSASLDGGSTYTIISENAHKSINDSWAAATIGNVEYFNPGVTNETASIAEGNANGPDDRRTGLLNPLEGSTYSSPINNIDITLQSVLNITNGVNTPSPSTGDYPKRSFDVPIPGDTGSIQVYVNDNATPKATISLTGSNGAITDTIGGITFNISPSGSNTDVTELDGLKAHRSGSFTIDTSIQKDGYNYAFVFYTGSRGTTQIRALTNFVEWFYDDEGAQNNLSKTDGPNADFYPGEGLDATDITYLSGIKYYTANATDNSRIQKTAHCDNQYRNVYPKTGGIKTTMNSDTITHVSVTQSGANLSSTLESAGNAGSNSNTYNLQGLSDVDEAYLTRTEVTASIVPSFTTQVNGFHQPTDFFSNTLVPFSDYAGSTVNDIQIGIAFEHFNKDTNITSYDTDTINDYLVLTATSASTNETTYEQFRGEKYRIPSASYTHNSFVPSSNTWDSTKTLKDTGDAGYNTGLLQYASYLCHPTKAGLSADGGNFTTGLGPASQQDYSTGLTGNREYFRYFKVAAGGAKDFQFEFKGSGRIVLSSTSLSANSLNMHVYVQRLGDGTNGNPNSTFLNQIDALDSSGYAGNTLTNSSHYIPLDNNDDNITYANVNSVGSTPTISVPTGVVAVVDNVNSNALYTNEYILLRIVVGSGWTGYIDSISMRTGQFNDFTVPQLQSLGSTH